jgi:hypothetical protein
MERVPGSHRLTADEILLDLQALKSAKEHVENRRIENTPLKRFFQPHGEKTAEKELSNIQAQLNAGNISSRDAMDLASVIERKRK